MYAKEKIVQMAKNFTRHFTLLSKFNRKGLWRKVNKCIVFGKYFCMQIVKGLHGMN